MPTDRKNTTKPKRHAPKKENVQRFNPTEWREWVENRLPSELRSEIERRGFVKKHKSFGKKNNDEELSSYESPSPFYKKGKGGYFIWAKPKGDRPFTTGIKFDNEIDALKYLITIFESLEGYQNWGKVISSTNSTWRRKQKEKVNALIAEFTPEHIIFDKFRELIGNELADLLVFELGVEQYSKLILKYFKVTTR